MSDGCCLRSNSLYVKSVLLRVLEPSVQHMVGYEFLKKAAEDW